MTPETHIFTSRTALIAFITALIGIVMIAIGDRVMWMIGFAA